MKNSEELTDFIQNLELSKDDELISLDVISLFTNISEQSVLEIISRRWDEIKQSTNLSLQVLLNIMKVMFDTSYFSFNNIFYKQDGSTMENPVSPILMEDLISTVISKLDNEILLLKVYVDDTILAVPKSKINSLLIAFNSYHSGLQFIIETENNNSIPFLDVLLIRTEDQRLNLIIKKNLLIPGEF